MATDTPAPTGIGVLRRDFRTDPFFDGAAADRLVIRRCADCDLWLAPDATCCPGCGSEEPGWADAAGDATLVTWTVVHGRPAEDGTVPPPAVLALVELTEGPWLHTRLVGVERAALREGLPLTAVFEHPGEGESYLLFRPA
ncbi:Zn-ribbon domain-containing OB-fold protein [Actinomadura atramentaria]|uniref:Zn-ribbon domain-containing OB-fold protein n=1 Tax=Actinomadura atramentaria TaxID=1990 RepID=UPI00036F5281|nr:OB-fold domain-containing protein [Actinomadura atramentaria]